MISYEIFWAWMGRDLGVRVGVRVRDSMMISQFDHEELRVYPSAIGFVAWLEEAAASITSKVSACGHLARASAGVPVNMAEASGKRSMNERRPYIDTAYGSSLP